MTQMKLIGASLTGMRNTMRADYWPRSRAPALPPLRNTADREGHQLPAPQRRHEDRFPGNRSAPGARGEAKVEGEKGYIRIEAEFDGPAAGHKNGAEYLTYVLWAITPEGRTANLGESCWMERRAS
jgi:hypothetical protein